MADPLPLRLPTIVQTGLFTRQWTALGLDSEAIVELEGLVVRRSEDAPVVSGTGGVRKIRFSPSGSGRGKSGGLRVCYAVFPRMGAVLLLMVYTHAIQDNITPGQARALREVVESFEAERLLIKKGRSR